MNNEDFTITKESPEEEKIVYRPILERDSALLEVQSGCSYRRCKFCDFIKDEFKVYPLPQIRHNIELLAETEAEKTSLFILGQNALCLKTDILLEIITYVRACMPNIREINLYGRAEDINRKGMSDMAKLKAAGLSFVHVGVESGSDRVLTMVNKGETHNDMLQAFHTLDALGLHYHITYILGLGGLQLSREHVEQTILLFNAIHPVSIWALALKLWPGTPLYEEAMAGKFSPLSPEQMLMEEKLILEQLEIDDCLYMDTTAMQKYTLIGLLQRDKRKLLQAINDSLAPYDLEDFLRS